MKHGHLQGSGFIAFDIGDWEETVFFFLSLLAGHGCHRCSAVVSSQLYAGSQTVADAGTSAA